MGNFVLYGVSGSGKSKLLEAYRRRPGVSIHTKDSTRELRLTEDSQSMDLSLIREDEFDRRAISNNYSVTYRKYGHWYGVVNSQVKIAERNNESHLIIIRNIDAIRKFCRKFENTKCIYVHSDKNQIASRLKKRGDVDLAERLRRVDEEYNDFLQNNTLFDYVILNSTQPSDAYIQFENILKES